MIRLHRSRLFRMRHPLVSQRGPHFSPDRRKHLEVSPSVHFTAVGGVEDAVEMTAGEAILGHEGGCR